MHTAHQAKWWFCILLAACTIGLMGWTDSLHWLRYERTSLQEGEFWRAVTAHFVHLNATHLAFNVVSLFLLCELLWGSMPKWHGIALAGCSTIGVSALLFLLHPELIWYVGLSGLLHGLWAGLAWNGCCTGAALIRSGSPAVRIQGGKLLTLPSHFWLCAIALILLAVKLLSEIYFGPSAYMAQAIGGDVIYVAHLYGALVGSLYVLLWRCAMPRS